jgi:hypothetical protein
MSAIYNELLVGTPSGLNGPEYDAFREQAKREIEQTRSEGGALDMPSDPDLSW